jgi:hypothetical protein
LFLDFLCLPETFFLLKEILVLEEEPALGFAILIKVNTFIYSIINITQNKKGDSSELPLYFVTITDNGPKRPQWWGLFFLN